MGTHVFISNAQAQTPVPSAAPVPATTTTTAATSGTPAAAAPASGDLMSTLGSLPLLLAMFAVMYFVMIRPQMKRQKEHKTMLEALAKGDEVVTAGGLVGRVSKMSDSFLHVEVANGTELQVQRSAVVQVLPKGTFGK
jgi:preprotein translocase subunit YajC